jgi:predicted GIY-YIG superfamily endonuclease
MEIGDESPTALYRLYAASGDLLYIGISNNLKVRFAEHAADKHWWPEVARKTAEWHATWEGADEAETLAIRAEKPIHNKRKNPSYRVRQRSVPGAMETVSGSAVAELVLSDLHPTPMRLALLQLAGMSTRDALDAMGVSRTNRYRVLAGLR